jgi:hypothetical protein
MLRCRAIKQLVSTLHRPHAVLQCWVHRLTHRLGTSVCGSAWELCSRYTACTQESALVSKQRTGKQTRHRFAIGHAKAFMQQRPHAPHTTVNRINHFAHLCIAAAAVAPADEPALSGN